MNWRDKLLWLAKKYFWPALVIFLAVGLAGLVYLFFNPSERARGKLLLSFLDVGQGDAILLRTPRGRDILIDGWPDKKTVKALGNILPFFDRRLELVILTHPHADHAAGLVEVLKRYRVDKIIMASSTVLTADSLAFWQAASAKNIPLEKVDQSLELSPDVGVKLMILHPLRLASTTYDGNPNNDSLIAKISYASTSALLMADYENEETLSLQSIMSVKADLLKVGHHGSTNANNRNFLALVEPDYAVISVGKNNRYDHPHYRVLHELKSLGAKIWRTDQSGTVSFFSAGGAWQLLAP